jgi:beta-lactamase class A
MPSNQPAGQKRPIKRVLRHPVFLLLCGAALAVGGYGLGWHIRGTALPQQPEPIRQSGYTFISPLLSCNFGALNIFPQDQSMIATISQVINKHIANGDITNASVYWSDFSNGEFANVNGNETFYPSSITKIPIMMTYYELAETDPDILNQEITYPLGSPDLNDSQETKPEVSLVPGQSYTVEDLIEHMIKYSDNNAATLLFENANQDALNKVYGDLQIPVEQDVNASDFNFITPQQISVLFRVLYNATYLSRNYSEMALNLLSQTTFTQGIVAGVPASTTVSHKFGIVGITQDGMEVQRELHDCGIIYAPNHPYQICIMTHGNATSSLSLAAMEGTIADISQTVYNKVESRDE